MAIMAWNDQRNWKNSLRTCLQLVPLKRKIQVQWDKESEEYERRNETCREKETREKISEKIRASKKNIDPAP
jgi:hypothetical protein